MAPLPGEEGAAKEHAAAVTRDYISQPRISELFNTVIRIEFCCLTAYCFVTCLEIHPGFTLIAISFLPAGSYICVDFLFLRFVFSAYRTVSGVNGPLVILDDVKV